MNNASKNHKRPVVAQGTLKRPWVTPLLVLAALALTASPAAAERDVARISGVLDCSAGLRPTAVSTQDCVVIGSPDSTLYVSWQNLSQASGAVYEVEWAPQRSPGDGHELLLQYPLAHYTGSLDTNGRPGEGSIVEGPSRLTVRLTAPTPTDKLYNHAERFAFGLRAVRGLVLEQPFEFAATWFYNETVPAGYSAFEDRAPDAEAPQAMESVPASNPLLPTAASPSLVPISSTSAEAWTAASVLALAFLFVVRYLGLGPLRYAAFAAAFFTRIREDDALGHPRRDALYRLVQAEPGISYAQARSRLDCGAGTFDYHLRVLVRHRLLAVSNEPGRVGLYLPGARPAPVAPPAERLLALVKAEPGLGRAELARRLGLHEDTVGYHATWLQRRGRLEKREDGRSLRYFPPSSEAF